MAESTIAPVWAGPQGLVLAGNVRSVREQTVKYTDKETGGEKSLTQQIAKIDFGGEFLYTVKAYKDREAAFHAALDTRVGQVVALHVNVSRWGDLYYEGLV